LTPPANDFGNQRRNAAKSKPLVAVKNFYFKYMKTPETDAAQREGLIRTIPIPMQVVTSNFARKLERERDEAREKMARQSDRIRYLEGATNHAEGTPLSIALRERDEAREEVRLLKAILDLLKKEAQ